MDTHYGHHSDILSLDYYSKDRIVSCALDRQCIFWKIDEDSELLYNNLKHSVDSIHVLTNQFFYTTSTDNAIDLWIMNKKKPIYSLEGLHNDESWILSSANVRDSDLFSTGSYDGQIVLYGFNKENHVREKPNKIVKTCRTPGKAHTGSCESSVENMQGWL